MNIKLTGRTLKPMLIALVISATMNISSSSAQTKLTGSVTSTATQTSSQSSVQSSSQSTISQPVPSYVTDSEIAFLQAAIQTAEGREFFKAATHLAAQMQRDNPAGFINFVTTGTTAAGGGCKIMSCSAWVIPCIYDKVSCAGLTSGCNCSCGGSCG